MSLLRNIECSTVTARADESSQLERKRPVLIGMLSVCPVTVIVPGFPAPQQAETAAVMRIVLISTVVFGISAVQGGHLYTIPQELLERHTPRILDGAGLMCERLESARQAIAE